MSKLIIDYPHATSEEIEWRDGGRVDKYQWRGPGVGLRPNPGAWCLRPYERYLSIEVEMQFMRPNLVRVEREICTVETLDEGTIRESYSFRTIRSRTMHLLTGDELGAAWPEIERRKEEGVRLTVAQLPTIMKNPWEVSIYCGI